MMHYRQIHTDQSFPFECHHPGCIELAVIMIGYGGDDYPERLWAFCAAHEAVFMLECVCRTDSVDHHPWCPQHTEAPDHITKLEDWTSPAEIKSQCGLCDKPGGIQVNGTKFCEEHAAEGIALTFRSLAVLNLGKEVTEEQEAKFVEWATAQINDIESNEDDGIHTRTTEL